MQSKEKSKISSVITASMGNLIEWFDFYIYAFTATYFAHNFSASSSPAIQQASAFAVFMIGFFMRPIGGLFLVASQINLVVKIL